MFCLGSKDVVCAIEVFYYFWIIGEQSMILPFRNTKTTSPYGMRTINEVKQFHHGIDMIDSSGDNRILAPTDLNIVAINDRDYDENQRWNIESKHSLGKFIIARCEIDNKSYYMYFCHLEDVYVDECDSVPTGTHIALMGNTGYSYGAHLHLEIRDLSWSRANIEAALKHEFYQEDWYKFGAKV